MFLGTGLGITEKVITSVAHVGRALISSRRRSSASQACRATSTLSASARRSRSGHNRSIKTSRGCDRPEPLQCLAFTQTGQSGPGCLADIGIRVPPAFLQSFGDLGALKRLPPPQAAERGSAKGRIPVPCSQAQECLCLLRCVAAQRSKYGGVRKLSRHRRPSRRRDQAVPARPR